MSSPETEWIASRSALEIDALKLDPEAKRKLAEDLAAIEIALDELLTAALQEMKTRRPKLARLAGHAALEQHKTAIRNLGLQIHQATNSLNTMRLICMWVSDRHLESSNARGNIIEALWDGVGYWRA